MALLAVAGFGKLGSALVRGALSRGVVRAADVLVWARSEPRRKLAAEMGLALVEWPEVLHAAPTVLLALKPQAFESMTAGIQRVDPATHWISVMSGWTSAELTARLGGGPAIRAMPSVAASVGASTTGLCVPMGALEQAAIQAGLSPATASAVAIGAVEGAVAGVRGGMGTPAELRAQVTSPGGTTAAGLAALQAGQMQALITRAVLVARDRAQELGGGTGR